MNQINDLPTQDYDFGLEFNYAVWTAGTTIDLCNVRWNNDYRDVVRFDNPSALDTYIDGRASQGVTLNELSYVKPNTPIRIPLPINKVIKYNYLRAHNPVQPVSPTDEVKKYYYFITDVRYIAPNTTEIVVQLDVFQTFIYGVTFGNCYIERGHIGIANENNFNNYGRDYLTIPEGLNLGGEYLMPSALVGQSRVFAEDPTEAVPNFGITIIAVSTVDLLADPGNVNNPNLKTAKGSSVGGLPSGATLYAWETGAKFRAWLTEMQDKPWVTQGIISIFVVPHLNRYHASLGTWPVDNKPLNLQSVPNGNRIWSFIFNRGSSGGSTNFRNEALKFIPERYRALKKFLTSPYMLIELTNYTGASVILKPELIGVDNVAINEEIGLVPPDVRVAYTPVSYNSESYNVTLWLKNLPKMPVVNNMAISYMSSNAATIAYQYNNADWSQQRALAAAQATYDNVTSGMNLANELTQIGIGADIQGTGVTNSALTNSALINVGQNLLGGMASGNPSGMLGGVTNALAGTLQTLNTQDANNQQLAIRNATANASNQASVGNTGFVRDTNKNLADWAAKGDYGMAIAGINAKVEDAQMIQPSASGAYGGETFMAVNGRAVVNAKIKLLEPASYRSIGEYWLRYGYAVQQFGRIPQNLMVMEKFTYWKLSETYITAGNMPETYKQAIRGMLEKGVTVWKNPTDIGTIDIADNTPLEGIVL